MVAAAAMDEKAAGKALSWRQIVLLGFLSAIGPIGVDIYLPAFPSIAADFGTDIGSVQLSMAVYFLALGLGQLPYGVLSDRIGRKRPILFGLAIFIVGSLTCALAPTVQMLIMGRFVQGLGICAILSIMRAIIRDVHRGGDAAHIAARMLLIVSISPFLAPLLGSAIADLASWRLIFWFLAILGGAGMCFTLRFLPETQSSTVPARTAASIAAHCMKLLSTPAFAGPMLLLAAAQAGASVYLAGSSAVYMLDYGVSSWGYSLAFAMNAGGMILSAQANRWMIGRVGVAGLTVIGTLISASAIMILFFATLAGMASYPLACVCFFLFFSGFGFVMGPASVLALEEQGEAAGLAAGLLGTVQFFAGAGAAALIGAAGQAEPREFLLLLVVSQLAAFAGSALCASGMFRRHHEENRKS